LSPKADGTIPEEQQRTMLDMSARLDNNGEAIYGARPWKQFGEESWRFTSKGGTACAIGTPRARCRAWRSGAATACCRSARQEGQAVEGTSVAAGGLPAALKAIFWPNCVAADRDGMPVPAPGCEAEPCVSLPCGTPIRPSAPSV
jgi:alpha-L-fucosidase